jgi:hypothetical protein
MCSIVVLYIGFDLLSIPAGNQGCAKRLLQRQNPGISPGAFTPIPAFPQIRKKTTDLGKGAKNFGLFLPCFHVFENGGGAGGG